jgi:hypothetical protein
MKNMTTTSRALGLGAVLALGALMASPTGRRGGVRGVCDRPLRIR